MRVPIRLPDLGSEPLEFSLWLVEVGEHVFEGDRLAEVLLPGACIDVAAPATGKLVDRAVYPRDVVKSGQILGYLESEIDE